MKRNYFLLAALSIASISIIMGYMPGVLIGVFTALTGLFIRE